eukprot:223139-Pyramimonas_sp.AAC.1
MGEKLARQLFRRAVVAGRWPQQLHMGMPLSIHGAGDGAQVCTHQVSTPMGVADEQGEDTIRSSQHQ